MWAVTAMRLCIMLTTTVPAQPVIRHPVMSLDNLLCNVVLAHHRMCVYTCVMCCWAGVLVHPTVSPFPDCVSALANAIPSQSSAREWATPLLFCLVVKKC